MKALVVIDVQREYTTYGRHFHIENIANSLKNAKTMLDYAREHAWPIVHVQHLQDGGIFNRTSEFSNFIDGFYPREGERLAAKGKYSSFSSSAFSKFAEEYSDHELVVIGYGTTMCCLSTIVDGFHRGYKFALVEDACAARSSKRFSEQSMHEHAIAILEPFARIARTMDETT
jgi:ureidoacrylate peracid hydrolase